MKSRFAISLLLVCKHSCSVPPWDSTVRLRRQPHRQSHRSPVLLRRLQRHHQAASYHHPTQVSGTPTLPAVPTRASPLPPEPICQLRRPASRSSPISYRHMVNSGTSSDSPQTTETMSAAVSPVSPLARLVTGIFFDEGGVGKLERFPRRWDRNHCRPLLQGPGQTCTAIPTHGPAIHRRLHRIRQKPRPLVCLATDFYEPLSRDRNTALTRSLSELSTPSSPMNSSTTRTPQGLRSP